MVSLGCPPGPRICILLSSVEYAIAIQSLFFFFIPFQDELLEVDMSDMPHDFLESLGAERKNVLLRKNLRALEP